MSSTSFAAKDYLWTDPKIISGVEGTSLVPYSDWPITDENFWVSIENRIDHVELLLHSPGSGFDPKRVFLKSVDEAKAKGEEWLKEELNN